MPERYPDVRFEFLIAADNCKAYETRGTVIVREGEMVLEVEWPDARPYLIRGKAKLDFFHGRHEGLPDDDRVEAKWIRLDDIYIGTWVEEGKDYLFRFRLPKNQETPAG